MQTDQKNLSKIFSDWQHDQFIEKCHVLDELLPTEFFVVQCCMRAPGNVAFLTNPHTEIFSTREEAENHIKGEVVYREDISNEETRLWIYIYDRLKLQKRGRAGQQRKITVVAGMFYRITKYCPMYLIADTFGVGHGQH